MKNAHLRFGTLRYTRRTHDTTIDVLVRMDRLILESLQDGCALAHLISVVGNDADIGGIWAAILDSRAFWVSGPDIENLNATMGDKPQCWRGSISIPGRKRPLRHLPGTCPDRARRRQRFEANHPVRRRPGLRSLPSRPTLRPACCTSMGRLVYEGTSGAQSRRAAHGPRLLSGRGEGDGQSIPPLDWHSSEAACDRATGNKAAN
jgi:hypothetical protein